MATILPLGFVNGQQAVTLSVFDRGLAYGDGLFETMWMINGVVPLWSYHYSRLSQGLNYLHIPLDRQRLLQSLQSCMSCVPAEAYTSPLIAKLIVTRGVGARGYAPSDTDKPTIVLLIDAVPECLLRADTLPSGIRLHLCRQRLPEVLGWAGLKSLNQLSYVLASHEVSASGCDEGLLLSQSGHVIEATARNLFLVADGRVVTPRLNRCGVKGVMREFMMAEVLNALGLPFVECDITPADVWAAEEVFVVNSVSGIWPVVACDHYTWPIGLVTQRIHRCILDITRQKINSLASSGSEWIIT